MASSSNCAANLRAYFSFPQAESSLFPHRRRAGCGQLSGRRITAAKDGINMKFALVNPNWNFEGSTYFGCQDPHYPLELMFAYDQIREAGDEPLLIDAQVDNLNTTEVRPQVDAFAPDFVVILTAPS